MKKDFEFMFDFEIWIYFDHVYTAESTEILPCKSYKTN